MLVLLVLPTFVRRLFRRLPRHLRFGWPRILPSWIRSLHLELVLLVLLVLPTFVRLFHRLPRHRRPGCPCSPP